MPDERITWLFYQYFDNIATPEEKAALMALLHEGRNEAEVQALMAEAWESFQAERNVFSPQQSKAMLQRALAREARVIPMRTPQRWRRWAVAAAILLLAGTGTVTWLLKQPAQAPPVAAIPAAGAMPQPGWNKAELTLADNSTVLLDSTGAGVVAKQGNMEVSVKKGTLAYQMVSDEAVALQTNRLRTPRGGQFKVVLPDGTQVWMNAASVLSYPTAFTGKTRTITLSGEAYFEVTKKPEQPFIVQTADVAVEVLGTHFNINAYEEEAAVRTTLLEGAVKVSQGTASRLLKPGEEAATVSFEQIMVKKADTEQALAWKNGYFLFRRASLEQVMRQLARWYDVEVVFHNNAAPREFTGEIPRNAGLQEVLRILSISRVKFKLKGNQLTII